MKPFQILSWMKQIIWILATLTSFDVLALIIHSQIAKDHLNASSAHH